MPILHRFAATKYDCLPVLSKAVLVIEKSTAQIDYDYDND
ncbi:MAG: hypothetical protein GQF41_4149 [Candidatus Rifleibacterium amylolyticum]|nr:MAG: hypothetical protein GQF41_4149 [Candidatus Rifleibacterium amylolyticum]